ADRACPTIIQARSLHHQSRHPVSPLPGPAAAATTAARDRHPGTDDRCGRPACPGPGHALRTPPAGAIVWVLVWAAWALITPGHGQSSTNGSLSVPAGLGHPKEKGSSDPCPAHAPG